MPISFLNPALLLGTLAAAAPVIIHFLSRRRVQRARFSDLRFLDEVQARQARSLGVRRWLLLLMRVLAIVCVALAAAGPRWGGLGDGAGAQAVLLIIDTSASMQTGQEGGTRLTAAVTAGREMINALPPETPVQVLVAGSRTEPLFGDWLPAAAGAVAGLGLVTPTDGAFDLAAALNEAGRLVARAPASPVQVILLSDLQAVPVDPAWEPAARRLQAAGPSDLLVLRSGEPADGGGVQAVKLPARAIRAGESIRLTADVLPQFVEQVFTLELDGRAVAEAVAPGPAGVPAAVEFVLTAPPVGRHRGVVRKETDALPVDDSRPFILDVPRRVQVLVAHGDDLPRDGAAGRGGWRYLIEALAPGGAESVFATTAVSSADLTTGAVAAADLVFLVEPDPLGRRILTALEARLDEGGQLVVLAGDPRTAPYLAETLLPALGLPGTAGIAVVGPPGQRLRIVDAEHPLSAGLDGTALQTLQEVLWRRWLRITEGPAQVVLTLTGDDPLLVSGEWGRGRFVLMPANLHPESGDLAGSPMALPFFQRLAGWLAGGAGHGLNLETGQVAVLVPAGAEAASLPGRSQDLKLLSVDGQASGAAEMFWHNGEPRLRAGVMDRAGFLTFLAGPDTVGQVAAAVPAGESRLALQTPAEFNDLLVGLDLEPATDLTGTGAAGLAAALAGHDLAVWLLGLALLLLAGESWLGRGTTE